MHQSDLKKKGRFQLFQIGAGFNFVKRSEEAGLAHVMEMHTLSRCTFSTFEKKNLLFTSFSKKNENVDRT
jgi:hypothetical protein